MRRSYSAIGLHLNSCPVVSAAAADSQQQERCTHQIEDPPTPSPTTKTKNIHISLVNIPLEAYLHTFIAWRGRRSSPPPPGLISGNLPVAQGKHVFLLHTWWAVVILLVMTFQCTWWDSSSSSSSSDQRAPLPPLVVVLLLLRIVMCACKRFSSSSHCCSSHHEEESFLANPKPFLLIRLNGSIFLTNESRRNMGFLIF